MNWNIFNTSDRTHRAPTIKALLALVAVVGFAGVAILGGGVAAEEVANETVEVDNSTAEIYTEIEFANVSDANATADVIVTDPNGSKFVNASVSGNGSETIIKDWTVNDSDLSGTYEVVVNADNGTVLSATAGTFSEGSNGGGGTADDADGWGTYQGYPVWMLAIGVVAVALVGQSREWWDLTEIGG